MSDICACSHPQSEHDIWIEGDGPCYQCSCKVYTALCILCSHNQEKHDRCLGRNHPPFCDGDGGLFECECEGFKTNNKFIGSSVQSLFEELNEWEEVKTLGEQKIKDSLNNKSLPPRKPTLFWRVMNWIWGL